MSGFSSTFDAIPASSPGHGERNQFGQDFEAAGRKWTPELCRKDSDGDGRTNGEELGDLGCGWRKGMQPDRTKGITHPGVPDAPMLLEYISGLFNTF